jgi:ribosomal protein S18 acetylase RimI-like enzyme
VKSVVPYLLKTSDIEKAKVVLSEAFISDPFFAYMLENRHDDVRILNAVHAFTLSYGIKYGEAYSPSQQIEGAAIWLTPGSTNITIGKLLVSGALKLLGILPKGGKDILSLAKRAMSYMKYSDGLHAQYAPDPHWYLFEIGIGDEHRGKGCASKLLNPIMERCDHDQVPCYLETNNSKNVDLYEHFGFVVKDKGLLPGSDLTHWAMLREPK